MEFNNGIISLDCTIKSHVYLVKDQNGYTMIDASFPDLGEQIINEIKSLKIDLKSIHQILITHSDWDHIGSLKYLVEQIGCKAYISQIEYDHWMEKGKDYPFIPQECFELLNLTKKYVIPITHEYIGEFKVIYTPYLFHSFGMTMYEFNDSLFCGDFIQSKAGKFMLIPSEYNLDENIYLNYIKNFDMSNIKYIFQSHGKPLPVDNNWKELVDSIF
ncbi:MAG: MBL fold metallo-hydrolase [Mycoplasmataceae bacterium]|nr:MBL fold metallo-hydrolase [Mycoplasmataceae bacterium]